MQTPISFVVYGTPRPKGSHRPFLHPRTRQIILRPASQGLKAWEESIRHEAQRLAERGIFFGGPVSVALTFVFARPKSVSAKKRAHMVVAPDIDKICRSIFDPLTGLLWRDDCQVVEVHAKKLYGAGDEPSRVEITLTEVLPQQAAQPVLECRLLPYAHAGAAK